VTTNVAEFETGIGISKNMRFSTNLFYINILDPILYIPNPTTGADYYTNFDQTGSYGIELSYIVKEPWGLLNFNYSYYKQLNNKIESYNIEGIPGTFGAFPQNKASLISSINLSNNITLNYNLIFYGKRYTYVHSDPYWSSAKLLVYKESFVGNIVLSYANLFTEGLSLSFGVYDFTNTKFEYINSYQGWQNQVPAMGREFVIKLKYNIKP